MWREWRKKGKKLGKNARFVENCQLTFMVECGYNGMLGELDKLYK